MNRNEKTYTIVMTAMMTCLVLLTTYTFKIPTPFQGYVHLGDAMIFLSVLVVGRKNGAVAAAFGSALADLLGGYVAFAPWTFVIKGLMALVMGWFIDFMTKKQSKSLKVCGVPLIEIVTDPDFRSASQVCTFLQALRELLISLGVSDCKMQEGSMRCDVNLSLREEGSTEYGTRCEMKNLNSFRAVTRAIAYEARRQAELLEKGEKVIQQTLRWDDDLGKTYAMRDKEDSQDYRYFPEPDLPPIVISAEHMQELKDSLPELPQARSQRYEALGLASQEARLLANTAWMTTLMDGALAQKADAKIAANWLIGPMASLWNEHAAQEEPLPFTGEQYGAFVQLITGNKINSSGAKTVLETMVETGKDPDTIVKEKNLAQMEDTDALLQVAKEVVAENQDTVEAYLGGREKAFASLIGAAMKKTRGKANPKVIRQLILDLIQK